MGDKIGTRFAIGLFAACALYGLFQARDLIRGPVLVVESPLSGTTLYGTLTEVRGFAKNVAGVELNGRPIMLDESGRFTERVLTPKGYGVVGVSAEDRFGRHIARTIELVGRPETSTQGTDNASSSDS